MYVYLKIKIKTLATEASDIRREERKINIGSRGRKRIARALHFGSFHNGDEPRLDMTPAQKIRLEKKLARSRAQLSNPSAVTRFYGLRSHRTNEVRSHARSAFLAYGFLRGVDYKRIETNARFSPDWMEVKRLIEKFSEEGTQAWEQRFAEFKIASGFVPKA